MKAVLLLLFAISAQAGEPPSVREEISYRRYYEDFFNMPGFVSAPKNAAERKLALDAVEDALLKGAPSLKLQHWYSPTEIRALAPVDQLRLFRLKAARQFASRTDELLAVERARLARPDTALRYEIVRAAKYFRTEEGKQLASGQKILTDSWVEPSVEEVHNLFFQKPALASFLGGRYDGSPRLFLFCRHHREYACVLVFKDKDEQPLREGGALWSQPAIAMSDGNIPYDERNGNTPMGVHLVDGVMPAADIPLYYGKFRRLILDFVSASTDEKEQKKLFPESSHASKWWREAVVARDIGRNLLRMHGTGSINPDSTTTFYPLLPTLGCVGQREGKYGKVDYTDQRALLDHWMKAAGLEPIFENEPKIRGLLYVIDIDNKAKPVKLADLKPYGIE
jgi:hypothetical protein